jgi:hypothetical protein
LTSPFLPLNFSPTVRHTIYSLLPSCKR